MTGATGKIRTIMAETLSWQEELADALPRLGHRNWIVVADSAYPEQVGGGIRTVTAADSHLSVVRHVAQAISSAPHVRAAAGLDYELAYLQDDDGGRLADYKAELTAALSGRDVSYQLHEEWIAELDKASRIFRILLIKTPMTMPYTTVFFKLECGYWDDASESRLRERMRAALV